MKNLVYLIILAGGIYFLVMKANTRKEEEMMAVAKKTGIVEVGMRPEHVRTLKGEPARTAALQTGNEMWEWADGSSVTFADGKVIKAGAAPTPTPVAIKQPTPWQPRGTSLDHKPK